MDDSQQSSDAAQAALLEQFGYKQELKRVMGRFSSFAVSFSGMSITNSIFLTLPFILTQSGSAGIWSWVFSSIGVVLVALVFCDLVTRIPIAGFAYQWSARLAGPRLSWFVAVAALIAFGVGAASVAYGTAPFFLDEFGIELTKTSQILWALFFTAAVATINTIGLRVAAVFNNLAVGSEMISGVCVGVGLIITVLITDPEPVSKLFHEQIGSNGGYAGAFVLAFLLGAYTYAAWELPADLAEETQDAPNVAPRAMLTAIAVTAVAGLALLVGFTYAAPGIGNTLGQDSPILYIIEYQWGSVVKDILNISFLVAFVSLTIVIMAGAARLLYSLARDNMVPFSGVLRRVSPHSKVPTGGILAAAVFMAIMIVVPPQFSPEVVGYILGTAAVGYNLVYLIMVGVYIVKTHRDELPPKLGRFSLGRWALPVAYAAFVWQLFLIGTLTLPTINQKIGLTTLGFFGVATIWYIVHVHPATGKGKAGPGIHMGPSDPSGVNPEPEPELVG